MSELPPLDAAVLPRGVRARFVSGINGLRVHMLEAGWNAGAQGTSASRGCILLLHGFPELAYSWRKIMPVLAAAGYHVVAPDLRGYGRTTGWDHGSDHGLSSCRMLNVVRDSLGLVSALGYRSVAAVVGHDFGSPVAAWCALVRPDVFRAVALMSAPFGGPPALPFNTANAAQQSPQAAPDIHAELAALPRPRKHYQWYYSTPGANAAMWQCQQGVHDFLRAYYHHKSADWRQNRPFRLQGWTAAELAKMPTYYVMDLHETMAETVAHEMPSAAEIAACRWLPDEELGVYSTEYQCTGFQGGLNWYRRGTGNLDLAELQLFSGRGIDVPATFIAGSSDWGTFQFPGALERMEQEVCRDYRGRHLIDGAGHWVQQEQPERVGELLLGFVRETGA